MGLKFFRSYFIMGVPSKLGMGEALQGFMDVEQLLNFQNQIDRGNPFKKVLNIFKVLLCGHTNLHKKGVIRDFRRRITGATKVFQDHPKLGQGVRKFFIQPGQYTEPPIIQGICSLWGDTQDFFPPGQSKVASGLDELVCKKIIRRRPSGFKLRLFGSGDPLKFRIVPDNIGKVID
nr:MAG TPA: hypothetical protein [Caudoviricetes sp.]